MNRQDDISNRINNNDIHQQQTCSSSLVSASWRWVTHPKKDKETEPPLWQYCRTGQWHSILEYFQNVGHCNDQYRYASSSSSSMDVMDADTAVTNQHHQHLHIDDRCLQYVIRSTTIHPTSGMSRHGSESSSSTAANQIDSASQRRVVELLLQHHPGLIAVIHPLTGTIAHEAIQYHNPNHMIHFLLQQMIHHENNIPQIPPLLFQVQDDIGRTILHCLIGRWQRSHCFYRQGMSTERHGIDDKNNIDVRCHHDTETVTHLQLFRLIVRAHPPQISIPDYDGYTPLLQLLQTTTATLHYSTTEWGMEDRRHSNTETTEVNDCDNEMYDMIQCMTQYQPNVVTILKRVPSYYHTYQPPPQHHHLNNHGRDRNSTCSRRSRSSTSSTCHNDRNAIHAPLFYALLYGQSQPTIQLLLDTYRQINDTPYSSLILSQYQEVALHIAITTSSSISILQCIVQDCHRSTVLYTDVHQLTPVDWLWLVYVREYSNSVLLPQYPDQNLDINNNNNNNATDPALHHLSVTTRRLRQIISRRRHLSNHIIGWHKSISTEQQQRVDRLFHSRKNQSSVALSSPIDYPDDNDSMGAAVLERTISMQNLENDFFHRLQIFLPFAASTLWQELQPCMMGVATGCRTPSTPFDNVETNAMNICLLLHAACYVPCPVTVIQLILLHMYRHPNHPPQQKHRNPLRDDCYIPLQYRDTLARRYPLHYAADRVSYRRCLPIGFNLTTASASNTAPHRSHFLLEDLTPVKVIAPLYPDACTRRDVFGQLPLHIVIDTYKRYRRTYYTRCRIQQNMNLSGNEHVESDGAEINHYNLEQDDVIELLVQLFPASLQMRDGLTMLYPYQQAAAGVDAVVTYDDEDTMRNTTNSDWNEADIHGCRLTTIYQLLRLDPTLIY